MVYLTKEPDHHHTAFSYFFLKKKKQRPKAIPIKETSRNRRQSKEHKCIYWHNSTALPQIYQGAKSKGLWGQFNFAVQHKEKPQLPPLPQPLQSAPSWSRGSYSPSFMAAGSFFKHSEFKNISSTCYHGTGAYSIFMPITEKGTGTKNKQPLKTNTNKRTKQHQKLPLFGSYALCKYF